MATFYMVLAGANALMLVIGMFSDASKDDMRHYAVMAFLSLVLARLFDKREGDGRDA